MNTATGQMAYQAGRARCSLAMQGEALAADTPANGSEVAALSRAYSAYALKTGSRLDEVQAISDHIRRRRFAILARSVRDFSLKVLVVASGIVLGVVSQQGQRLDTEAVRIPSERVAPAGLAPHETPGRADPVIDEVPPDFVYA